MGKKAVKLIVKVNNVHIFEDVDESIFQKGEYVEILATYPSRSEFIAAILSPPQEIIKIYLDNKLTYMLNSEIVLYEVVLEGNIIRTKYASKNRNAN